MQFAQAGGDSEEDAKEDLLQQTYHQSLLPGHRPLLRRRRRVFTMYCELSPELRLGKRENAEHRRRRRGRRRRRRRRRKRLAAKHTVTVSLNVSSYVV